MASKNFKDLMDLLFKQNMRIEKITVSPYGGGTGYTHINFVGSTDAFSSTEPDVVEYALHIRQTIDTDGNYELVAYNDLEQYSLLKNAITAEFQEKSNMTITEANSFVTLSVTIGRRSYGKMLCK